MRALEEKWLRRWEKEDIFSTKPERKPKFYLTVAYPYPSGSMHVGHGRTYTVPDVIARFRRMQGFNVLFPMAWHVTGTPVVGVAERIARGDEEAIRLYSKVYGVPEDILEEFTKPERIVEYFSRDYKRIMQRMGYTIDWTREFMTKDRQYNRFIEWQYSKLNKRGLVAKGKHPVKYCPNDNNPVGDHDLLKGEDAEINDFTLLKFKCNDLILPAATLRPETVFGTTNLWLNPDTAYVKARVDSEIWVISREASEKLAQQAKKVKIIGKIKGKELIGQKVVTPVTGKEVPILPATFLDPNYGTGVVFSVPAHAPFDYMALEDLKKAGYKEALSIEPIPIIDIKGYKFCPARELCEAMGIENQRDEKLEGATEKLYKEEHAKGRLKEEIRDFGGMNVNLAREKVRELMLQQGSGDRMYDFSKYPVVCRCNTECVIKILEDQWFLRYSDEAWKEKAHEGLKAMSIVPEETKGNFDHVIDWLHDWACTRRIGLGTKLPWDKKWTIEPLSDSTIYMAYYTISKHIREIDAEKLSPDIFDYLLLGIGEAEDLAKRGIEKELLKKMRREFEYWYPPDWRLSAKDLIGNHLTFHIFHHTAIFPPKAWPKGIVVFGMGLMEGEKMSSSKGNVVLLDKAIDDHGPDSVRLFLMGSAEPWQDFDWRDTLVRTAKKQVDKFVAIAKKIVAMGQDGKIATDKAIDKWLLSRLQRTIKETTHALENFQTRKALQSAFYLFMKDVQWYMSRAKHKEKGKILRFTLDSWVRLLSPFIPFTCEEIWESMDKSDLVSLADWPTLDEGQLDEKAELSEDLIKDTLEDLENILKLTKIKPRKIFLYTSPEWKWEVFELASRAEKGDMKEIMKKAMEKPELRKRGKEVSKFMGEVLKNISKQKFVSKIDEYSALKDAEKFFEDKFKCPVEVYSAEGEVHDPKNKRRFAMPLKPAIYVE